MIKQFFIIYFSYIKMPTGYYQKSKQKLEKVARERYQSLSEEQKKQKTSICS